ncbi:hypothetical protein C8R47DRAFT_1170627 [Mycena vitilis]|nr:hypothetical protein C8R47DRAFT_1170627 [Mycena vitilis]
MSRPSHPNAEPTSTSLIGNTGTLSSGMFSGAQNFTVTGQRSLKNIINNYTLAPVPSDFRMIPLGDIDLQQEISLVKDIGVVSRREHSDRRVYSAKVRDKDFTVAMYQGDGAVKEQWRQDLMKYSSLRHPNIFQIYGIASSGDIHATVFHGDLVLFEHCLDICKDFPCLTVYIYGSCMQQAHVRTRNLLLSPPTVLGCGTLPVLSSPRIHGSVEAHMVVTPVDWPPLHGPRTGPNPLFLRTAHHI